MPSSIPLTALTLTRPLRVLAVLCVLALAAPTARGQLVAGEYEIKAALLYNFTRFIEWPRQGGGEFRVCLVGNAPFGPELEALASRTVQERPIRVERRPNQLRDCHLVYVSEGAPPPPASPGTLLVAEDAAALTQGAVIGLRLEGERVAFDISTDAANRAGLKISYKLLRLARSVR